MNRRRALATIAAYPFLSRIAKATPVERLEAYRRDIMAGRTRSGVIACDSFGGRSSLGSTDGIPYRNGAGKAWTQQSGTIAPASGALKAGVAGIATIDPGVADAYRVYFQIVGATSGNLNSFAFRFTDTSNYLRLTITSSAMLFQTVIATTATSIGSGTTGVSPTAGDIVVVTVNGNSLSATIVRAGAVVGTAATATNSTGAGVTPMGFRFADTTISVTNLVVTRF